MLLHRSGRNGLAVASALRVGTATMYLQIWVWLLAVQYSTRSLRHVGVNHRLAALVCDEVCLRVRRIKVSLALLEMFNLPGCVLCSHEAAVLASDFVTFGGCVDILELYEGTANVGVRVSTHCGRC